MSIEFSRRDFIVLGGQTLLALASGCRIENPNKPGVKSVPETLEIKGKFPADKFSFTPAILEHDLAPLILPKNQWASDRMEAGIDYLGKLASALAENPQCNSSTLGSIGAVSEENFPIDFSINTTALDVIQNLYKNISDNRVILWGESKPNVPYLIGTINNPKYKSNSGWYMESQILANADFPFGNPRNEESDTTYSQYTDLQVALKMVHEYTHCRQGQQLLRLVLAEHSNDIIGRNYNVNYVSDLINSKVQGLITSMNASPKIDRNQLGGEVAFNEAQANQVSQLVLWSLNKLNSNRRMPGTEDDSYPVSYTSLYRTFQRAIVSNKNPYDLAWLGLHTNWTR